MPISRGWSGAGIGIALEDAFGTAEAAAEVWLRVEKENLKQNLVPRRRRNIFPGAAAGAAAVAAFPKAARYHGMSIPGGQVTTELVYEGLDRLFYNFFGNPATTNDGAAAYTHIFPNAVDQPTKPGLTIWADRDTSDLLIGGGCLTNLSMTIVPEEASSLVFDVVGNNSTFSTTGLAPTFDAAEVVVVDFHWKAEISVNAGAYAEVDFDAFNWSYNKNLRLVSAHDAENPGIRLPIRLGYPTIAGTLARYYENATYYNEYAALDELGIKLTADGQVIAGTGSTHYQMIIEFKNAIVQDTGPITDDAGPRVETLAFEADTDGTSPGVILTTINEDAAAWAT
jgi:hypothetical protein